MDPTAKTDVGPWQRGRLPHYGVPEEREYKARAFLGGPENEIGLESGILRCLFGGS